MSPPYLDLGSFLSFLESSNRLQRVRCPVDKNLELACIARWAMESTPPDQAYAILFERVKNHTVPVAVQLYATQETYAAAMGATPETILERWAAALAEPRSPRKVDQAPVHEVVETGEAVDLHSIPAPVWTPGRDAGPYLSAAVVITKDPETGTQNMATYRVQVHDGKRAGLFFGSRLQHGAMHYAKYGQRREPMPVAIVVGAPPVVNFAAAAKTAYGVDELTIAGGLAGIGLETVRCQTVDLMVPAGAEYVIEGRVPPDARLMEAPFGEALGYMNAATTAPYVEVTAVCHRASPVHHGYVQQLPPSDGHLVMELGVLGPLWFYLTRKLRMKGLRDLAIARGSAGVSALLVQVDRSCGGDSAAVGRIMEKLNFGQKFIYLLDEDVDLRDPETVNWAISSRVDPQRDVRVVAGTRTFQLDPSILDWAQAEGITLDEPPYPASLAVVDATLKCRVPEIALPGAALMRRALERWGETGLPPIVPRRRIQRLLATHSESDQEYDPRPAPARPAGPGSAQ